MTKRDRGMYWQILGGREGISKRMTELIQKYNENPSYKAVVELSGKLSLLADICKADDYWKEKMLNGYYNELAFLGIQVFGEQL